MTTIIGYHKVAKLSSGKFESLKKEQVAQTLWF